MLLSLWPGFTEEWALQQKVVFDGVNKLIIVPSTVVSLSVKTDIYSDWKEWMRLDNNAKFLPAIRVIGGDPISGGQFAGDIYFLYNGWRIQITGSCVIDGVIYSDNYSSPFIQIEGTSIVTNKVSTLVNIVSTSGGGSSTAPSVEEIRQEMDTNSIKLSSINTKVLTLNNAPTAAQNRQEMDTNSTKLSSINTKVQTLNTAPTSADIATHVRTELTPELTHLMSLENNTSTGLTSEQASMLLTMYELLGLDPTKPLVVTNTFRTAGTIRQTIATDANHTVVTRV